MYVTMAFIYLLHFAAAAMATRWRGCGGAHRNSGPSRAAMLYRRYFGINGTLFVYKAAALQLLTIFLQATAKVELLGMAVAMEGATHPGLEAHGIFLKPLYWTFVFALALNAVYPAVLLRSTRHRLQRDAVASIDVFLDIIYVVTFAFAMLYVDCAAAGTPTAPFLYVSTLWPLVHAHVVTTARAIEMAAVQRRAEAEGAQDGAQQQAHTAALHRLPRWAAAAFLVLAGLACSLPFLVSARDRYPFSNGDECRPCTCSGEAVLESCNIPATLGAPSLYLDGKGIRGIAPGVFRGLSNLYWLDLSRNNISALPMGAFDGLGRLQGLHLSAIAISTLGTDVF
jgi:hypothetical protein